MIRGLRFVQGSQVDVQSLIGKQLVCIEQSASWCGPCRQAAPHFSSLAQKFAKRNVYFVGVTDEPESAARQFIKQMGSKLTYNFAYDPDRCMDAVASQCKSNGIPAAYIIDHLGRIKGNKAYHPMDPSFESALDVAANEFAQYKAKQQQQPSQQHKSSAPTTPREDWSKQTTEQIMARSIKDLRAYMTAHNIDASDCVEKSDLVKKIKGSKLS